MRKRIILAIAIVAVAAIAGRFYSRAQEGGWRYWHNRDGRNWRNWHNQNSGEFPEQMVALLARRLDLSDEQQEQINQIISSESPAIESLTEQFARESESVREASADGLFDEAKVRQLAEQPSQTFTQLLVAKARFKAKIFAILTAEQRLQARKMLEHLRFDSRLHGLRDGYREGGAK